MRATIRPGPEASATALPLMPEKTRFDTTLTCARPPRKLPDHGRAEAEQALEHAGRVHHVGDEDEQRHGEQQVVIVEPVHGLVDDQAEVLVADHEIGEAGGEHGQPDRRAEHGATAKTDQRHRTS